MRKSTRYTDFSRRVFGNIFSKQKKEEIEEKNLILEQACIEMDYEEYYSSVLMNTLISIILGFILLATIYIITPWNNVIILLLIFTILPVFIGITVASIYLYLPKYYVKKRAENIENEILGSVKEAVNGVTEVSGNIQGVSNVAHETAQGANVINSAASELSGLAMKLQDEVAKFRL